MRIQNRIIDSNQSNNVKINKNFNNLNNNNNQSSIINNNESNNLLPRPILSNFSTFGK